MVQISVRNHDDSFIDVDDSNKKIIIRRNKHIQGVAEEREFELNENGDLFYTFETMENTSDVVLTAIYFDQSTQFAFWTGPPESEFADRSNLRAKVLTDR